MKKFKIWIEDNYTYSKVLHKMQEDDFIWSNGRKPLYYEIEYNAPIGLFVENDCISYCSTERYFREQDDYTKISIAEYLGEKYMTKNCLKDWMLVETREHTFYIVDRVHDILVRTKGWMPLHYYNDDLTVDLPHDHKFDIMKVYKIKYDTSVRLCLDVSENAIDTEKDLELLWDREKEPSIEMTVAEIEEKLGIKNLKIIKEHENE